MKNKRGLFSVILFLSALFLTINYFSRNNTSKSTVESKAVSIVTQTQAHHRIDAFLNSNVKPSTNIITTAEDSATNNQELDDKTKNLIAEEEALVRDCHSRSDGGSPETTKICAQMEIAFDKLISLGLCYGENSEIMADKRWGKCKVAQNSSLVNDSKVTNDPVATDQELQAIKPYIYAAETLNKTCSRAINGTIEKIQVCSQRDGAVQVLKNYGWCWKQDAEIESSKQWVKCKTEQKSSQIHNSVELQNNPLPTPQVASIDYKKEKSISEVTTKDNTEVSNKQDAQHHYYVQIGIFSDDANVKPLQDKLSDLGYKSQAETVGTDQGNKIRLRTQEFNNRNEAGIALNDIKDAGLTGMVVSIND